MCDNINWYRLMCAAYESNMAVFDKEIDGGQLTERLLQLLCNTHMECYSRKITTILVPKELQPLEENIVNAMLAVGLCDEIVGCEELNIGGIAHKFFFDDLQIYLPPKRKHLIIGLAGIFGEMKGDVILGMY